MQNKLTEAHAELIERLGKLTGPATTKEVEDCIRHSPWYHDAPSHDPLWSEFCRALQGSLDAAVALTERLLPGWKVHCLQHHSEGYWTAALRNDGGNGTPHAVWSSAPTPAIALLIATLRAQEDR